MDISNFLYRHNGSSGHDVQLMLQKIGYDSLDKLINDTVPEDIRLKSNLDIGKSLTEYDYSKLIKKIASKNKIFKTYIGQGYYNTIFPAVIQRNILENPSWYTSYTPYQAEISQGRLEALLNFQTVITELTGMEIANASLLDEATAAAEGMLMLFNSRSKNIANKGSNVFLVDKNIFPQTLALIKSRALPYKIEVKLEDFKQFDFNEKVFGVFVQYPAADGSVEDYSELVRQSHENNSPVVVAADILSLALLTPPGEWDADVVVGSVQRFGLPMAYGGPHAGYFATKEKYKRNMPGRIIGISVDSQGSTALRMALQTREQHIKRERATSNICTAQALLAIMAGMYVVYHGEEGLKKITTKINYLATLLSEQLENIGFKQLNKSYFDTLKIELPEGNVTSDDINKIAIENGINFNYIDNNTIGISLDETTNIDDINAITKVFAIACVRKYSVFEQLDEKINIDRKYLRKSTFLKQTIFYQYKTETEMMRYLKKLERKDISLTHSMISLGSCTMKLNAATEMIPLSWSEFGEIHPFVPLSQVEGYHQIINELGYFLKKITGFSGISFQPNSGANGEYTGLMVIREYLKDKKKEDRNIVLIPSSAHGTNPASAVMAGMTVIVVKCDDNGNIDVDDLKEKAEENKDNLAAFMITYPSTHGVFEDRVKEMIGIIHDNGGQVYMDGANMNAQVGLTSPGEIGADVCHLNLHKTFAIPHGGGGPGVGPICVADHLVEYLPSHPVVETGGSKGNFSVSAAPFGSASIITISYAYCKLLGGKGLTEATKVAILNANYIASSLKDYYDLLYTGKNGLVAHEMIFDCRKFKQSSGISETDISKRLMDYGFHAPTLSFPVHGTLMIEPTESESLYELNRFIETMISIYNEIKEIENGVADKNDNVLVNAPHTASIIVSDNWDHKYDRRKAVFPLKWIEDNKFWPAVSRLDDAYGDRNLVCNCSN